MSSVIPFILQTYDEWKSNNNRSFSAGEYTWTFSSNVIGDNISIHGHDGSNKRRFIIQSKGLLLSFMNDYFCV